MLTTHWFIRKALFTLVVGLAACGGGSGGGGTTLPHITPSGAPSSPPTATPTPSTAPAGYKITLTYTGGLQPRTAASSRRRTPKDSGSSPAPILLVEPDSEVLFGTPTLLTGENGSNVGVAVSVSPMPSSAPQFSASDPDVALATPAPNSAYQQVVNSDVANTAPVAGTFTVTVSPTSVTASVFTYERINLGCANVSPSQIGATGFEYAGGVKFVNGAPVAQTDPSASDVYISGPTCYGNFQSMEAENTLHFPGGGASIDPTISFNTLTASSWSNAATSFTTASLTDGSTPISNVLAIETIDPTPAVVFINFLSEAAGGPTRGYAQFSGGSKECGFATDGSC
jgi:hypothetical protein